MATELRVHQNKCESVHGIEQESAVYPCPLVAPADYFARYGEHLADVKKPREAWARVENDFREQHPGLMRFCSYDAFRESFRRHRKKTKETYFKIHIQW